MAKIKCKKCGDIIDGELKGRLIWCSCESCQPIIEKYGGETATQILFVKEVTSILQKWLDEEKEGYKNVISLMDKGPGFDQAFLESKFHPIKTLSGDEEVYHKFFSSDELTKWNEEANQGLEKIAELKKQYSLMSTEINAKKADAAIDFSDEEKLANLGIAQDIEAQQKK